MGKIVKPIRYFGAKGNFYKEVLKYFPKAGTYEYYIEPFGGSYTMGLTNPFIAAVEIYNDLERNVYSLYKVLSDKDLFTKFKEKCDLIYYDEDLRKEFKNKLKSDDLDLVDRAFYFFYVNRTSYNGIGGFSCNTVIRRNMSKSISDMLSTIDMLPELHQRLSRVIVLNKNAFDIIEKYGNKESVFIQADPPYVQDTRSEARYDVDMTNEQHNQFIELCLKCKCKMLINGYDHPIYDKLTDNGWEKIQFEVNTTSGTHKPKTKVETIWRNYV